MQERTIKFIPLYFCGEACQIYNRQKDYISALTMQQCGKQMLFLMICSSPHYRSSRPRDEEHHENPPTALLPQCNRIHQEGTAETS